MNNFSDYIIYIDESGDANWSISHDFPVLCLNFCIFNKNIYLNNLITEFNKIKFKYWGNDNIVFHERSFRRPNGIDDAFLRSKYQILMKQEVREAFMADINDFIEHAEFKIFSVLIDKREFKETHKNYDPYHICLSRGMRQVHDFLKNDNVDNISRKTHFIFEQRGKEQDRELRHSFEKIKLEGALLGQIKYYNFSHFYCEMKNKNANSTGLQIADITARPIALNYLNNTKNDRVFSIIKQKLFFCQKNKCEIGKYDVVHKSL